VLLGRDGRSNQCPTGSSRNTHSASHESVGCDSAHRAKRQESATQRYGVKAFMTWPVFQSTHSRPTGIPRPSISSPGRPLKSTGTCARVVQDTASQFLTLTRKAVNIRWVFLKNFVMSAGLCRGLYPKRSGAELGVTGHIVPERFGNFLLHLLWVLWFPKCSSTGPMVFWLYRDFAGS